eukprot:CAMPEP_0170583366 /NCGR_PEP_ID=MMETSP0224-20130122/8094_1 /TAXON_ID=285029 /ORGANISM="Togula jolla, Strain CCCM 725" /LENGTH=532 /DNA_ID=CAMNT_0010906683 /DNA_START=21 /DNA_END=1616 /DNA_ORIENTATION=-
MKPVALVSNDLALRLERETSETASLRQLLRGERERQLTEATLWAEEWDELASQLEEARAEPERLVSEFDVERKGLANEAMALQVRLREQAQLGEMNEVEISELRRELVEAREAREKQMEADRQGDARAAANAPDADDFIFVVQQLRQGDEEREELLQRLQKEENERSELGDLYAGAQTRLLQMEGRLEAMEDKESACRVLSKLYDTAELRLAEAEGQLAVTEDAAHRFQELPQQLDATRQKLAKAEVRLGAQAKELQEAAEYIMDYEARLTQLRGQAEELQRRLPSDLMEPVRAAPPASITTSGHSGCIAVATAPTQSGASTSQLFAQNGGVGAPQEVSVGDGACQQEVAQALSASETTSPSVSPPSLLPAEVEAVRRLLQTASLDSLGSESRQMAGSKAKRLQAESLKPCSAAIDGRAGRGSLRGTATPTRRDSKNLASAPRPQQQSASLRSTVGSVPTTSPGTSTASPAGVVGAPPPRTQVRSKAPEPMPAPHGSPVRAQKSAPSPPRVPPGLSASHSSFRRTWSGADDR